MTDRSIFKQIKLNIFFLPDHLNNINIVLLLAPLTEYLLCNLLVSISLSLISVSFASIFYLYQ